MIFSYREFLDKISSNDPVYVKEAEAELSRWAHCGHSSARRSIAQEIPDRYLYLMIGDHDEQVAVIVAKRLPKKLLRGALKDIIYQKAIKEIFRRINPKAVPNLYRKSYNDWL